MVLGASAQVYKLEKVWELTGTENLPPTLNDARQGFGMNDRFYVNDKGAGLVYVYDQNGPVMNADGSQLTFPGGSNCAINRDDAGNLVVSMATFPGSWRGDTVQLKVVDPTEGTVKEYILPETAVPDGRCDFLGRAMGNLMTDGELDVVGGTTTGVCKILVMDGEMSTDDSYIATCDGLTASTSTIINHYVDLDGNDAWLYVTRNVAPVKMVADGENYAGTALTLPNKGACNGADAFVYGDAEYFVYPTLPNYENGFAIANAAALDTEEAAPVVEQASTVTGNPNGFQCNWLNAEVSEADNCVYIYQYAPGNNMTKWKFMVEGTAVETINANKTVSSVEYVNMAGMTSSQAFDGVNVVVTTYTDGTKSTAKELR